MKEFFDHFLLIFRRHEIFFSQRNICHWKRVFFDFIRIISIFDFFINKGLISYTSYELNLLFSKNYIFLIKLISYCSPKLRIFLHLNNFISNRKIIFFDHRFPFNIIPKMFFLLIHFMRNSPNSGLNVLFFRIRKFDFFHFY